MNFSLYFKVLDTVEKSFKKISYGIFKLQKNFLKYKCKIWYQLDFNDID